jgi:hypothetical protein
VLILKLARYRTIFTVWQFDRLDHLFREDDFGGDDKSWDECVGLVLLNF